MKHGRPELVGDGGNLLKKASLSASTIDFRF